MYMRSIYIYIYYTYIYIYIYSDTYLICIYIYIYVFLIIYIYAAKENASTKHEDYLETCLEPHAARSAKWGVAPGRVLTPGWC